MACPLRPRFADPRDSGEDGGKEEPVLPVNMNTNLARHTKAAGAIVVVVLVLGLAIELL